MNTFRYYATLTIVRLYFAAALAFSFDEIHHGFLRLGTQPAKAWFAPICIDLFAVLGAIARSNAFNDRTRRIGFRVQVVASSISLVTNVAFGQSAGDRIFGAMIVIGYVFSEWFADNMERRTEDTDAPAQSTVVEQPAPVLVVAQPAAAPKSRKGQPWSPERRARFEAKKAVDAAIAELEDRFTMASAPTSPAPTGAAMIGSDAAYM